MTHARKVATGILSNSAAAWTRQVATLVLYTIAARLLDPDQIGVFALASALILLVEYGVYDSISETVVQREMLEGGHAGAALLTAGVAAVASIALAVLLSPWLSRFFNVPQLHRILPPMSIAVATLCLSAVHAGILRREARFHLISLISPFAALTACAVGVALMISGWGVWSLVAYFMAEKLTLAIGMTAFAIRQPISRFSRSHIHHIAAYAGTLSGQRMTFFARNQMDRLLIAWLWGPDVLGAYQLATRVLDAMSATLLAPATKLLFVSYARLQGSIVELRAAFLRSLEAIAFVAFPAFAGLSAVGPDVVRVLFGKNWHASEVILQVFALGGLPLVVNVMSGTLLSAAGRAKTSLLIELAATVLGACVLAALSRFGIVWIAAALVIREMIMVLVYMAVVRTMLMTGLRRYTGAFGPFLVTSIAMLIFTLALGRWVVGDLAAWASFAVIAVSGAAFYSLVMYATRRSQLAEALAMLRGRAPRSEQTGEPSPSAVALILGGTLQDERADLHSGARAE